MGLAFEVVRVTLTYKDQFNREYSNQVVEYACSSRHEMFEYKIICVNGPEMMILIMLKGFGCALF